MICAPTMRCGSQRSIWRGGTLGRPSPISPLALCEGAGKKHSRPVGRLCRKELYLLQVEESLHAGILGHVAQPPIVCQRTQWGPGYLKCSGEVNSPCAKVFACGKNACTRLPAPPLRRHKIRSAPFLPAAKTSLRSLAPPPPRRPTALGSSGAPKMGPRGAGRQEKAKPPDGRLCCKIRKLTSG